MRNQVDTRVIWHSFVIVPLVITVRFSRWLLCGSRAADRSFNNVIPVSLSSVLGWADQPAQVIVEDSSFQT